MVWPTAKPEKRENVCACVNRCDCIGCAGSSTGIQRRSTAISTRRRVHKEALCRRAAERMLCNERGTLTFPLHEVAALATALIGTALKGYEAYEKFRRKRRPPKRSARARKARPQGDPA